MRTNEDVLPYCLRCHLTFGNWRLWKWTCSNFWRLPFWASNRQAPPIWGPGICRPDRRPWLLRRLPIFWANWQRQRSSSDQRGRTWDRWNLFYSCSIETILLSLDGILKDLKLTSIFKNLVRESQGLRKSYCRYIIGTSGLCLYLWQMLICESKSITIYCMECRLIWNCTQRALFITSSKQTIVAKSSTEAEMIAVSDHAGELIAQNEFHIHQCGSNRPVILYQDNQSTIRLLKNAKTRQIGRSILKFATSG